MRRIINWAIQTVEFSLAGLFLWGAFAVFTRNEPVVTEIDYLKPLVGETAIFSYGVMFALLGIGLIAGKVFKYRAIHGYALMGMYLIGVYVIILKWLLEGLSYDMALNIAVCLITAILYLRWKYNILYFTRPTRRQVLRDLFNEER